MKRFGFDDVTFNNNPVDTVTFNGVTVWSRLPTGLQLIEYLELSGTQWIDTGFRNTENTTIYADVWPVSRMDYCCFYGHGKSNINAFRFFTSGSVLYVAGGEYRSEQENTLPPGRIRSVHSTSGASVNGVAINTSSGSNSNTIFIAHDEISISTIYAFKGKIYGFKIEDNGIVVRDFHPAIYNDNPCLWDFIGNKPYYNSGTGEFAVSPY